MSNDYCEEHGQHFPCNECQRLWAFATKSHVCPPISAALREKIQKRIEWQDAKRLAPSGNVANTQRLYAYVDALRWLLREADALAEREGKAK